MDWSREVNCLGSDIRGCGTRLVVTEADLYVVRGTDYDDTQVSSIVCCCPKCGIETSVQDVDGIPRGSRPSKARRRRLYEAWNEQALAN